MNLLLDLITILYLIVSIGVWIRQVIDGWQSRDSGTFLLMLATGWALGLLWLPVLVFGLVIDSLNAGVQFLMDRFPR